MTIVNHQGKMWNDIQFIERDVNKNIRAWWHGWPQLRLEPKE